MLALEFLRREGYIADVENAEIVDVAVRVAQKQMKHSEVVQWLDRITSRAMADTSTKDPGPLTFRPATAADREFAFRLKKATLGEQIRQVWGWDEEEQRRLHEGRFAAQDFQVIRASGAEVGLLALDRRPDSVNVNQLLVCPEYQGRGIGTACMMQVIKCAADLPVRLRVLKVNRRAAGFYRRLGFSVSGETETHLLMERRPGAGAD
jgi:GNAT superfamily N-acetyltransferase